MVSKKLTIEGFNGIRENLKEVSIGLRVDSPTSVKDRLLALLDFAIFSCILLVCYLIKQSFKFVNLLKQLLN
jgi:hypothetical protein